MTASVLIFVFLGNSTISESIILMSKKQKREWALNSFFCCHFSMNWSIFDSFSSFSGEVGFGVFGGSDRSSFSVFPAFLGVLFESNSFEKVLEWKNHAKNTDGHPIGGFGWFLSVILVLFSRKPRFRTSTHHQQSTPRIQKYLTIKLNKIILIQNELASSETVTRSKKRFSGRGSPSTEAARRFLAVGGGSGDCSIGVRDSLGNRISSGLQKSSICRLKYYVKLPMKAQIRSLNGPAPALWKSSKKNEKSSVGMGEVGLKRSSLGDSGRGEEGRNLSSTGLLRLSCDGWTEYLPTPPAPRKKNAGSGGIYSGLEMIKYSEQSESGLLTFQTSAIPEAVQVGRILVSSFFWIGSSVALTFARPRKRIDSLNERTELCIETDSTKKWKVQFSNLFCGKSDRTALRATAFDIYVRVTFRVPPGENRKSQ